MNDIDEDAVTVFIAKEPWEAGMFCRSIWQGDGIEYEGLVKSIEIDQDDHHYAVVQFIGYVYEDRVWLQYLMESKGEAEREYQSKCAEGFDDQAPSTNVDHEEVILAMLVEDPAEQNVSEDQNGYEMNDIDEDAITVFVAKEPWEAGMFCRSIWQEDGIEYEGLVKSIEIYQDDHHYAVVQFIGYRYEDAVWLQDLMESNGK